MGFLQGKKSTANLDWSTTVVDLSRFRCGRTALGEILSGVDVYQQALEDDDVLEDEPNGVELGTAKARLDYVYIDIRHFPGRFLAGGNEVAIGLDTSEAEVCSLLGEPWWRDEDEDEILLFYEDARGELQVELTKEGTLRQINLLHQPLMADPEQRAAYGVTKPWPPG
jgi:hypothetical protein